MTCILQGLKWETRKKVIRTSHSQFAVQLRVHLFISSVAPYLINCLPHHGYSKHKALNDDGKIYNFSG